MKPLLVRHATTVPRGMPGPRSPALAVRPVTRRYPASTLSEPTRARVASTVLRIPAAKRRSLASHKGAGGRPETLVSRRTILVTFLAATLLVVIFLHDFREAGLAADRLKRIHELEAREAYLYAQLAQKDAQRESQRRIYIDRIRKGEAQLREHALEIMTLRRQSAARPPNWVVPSTSAD
jgi:hypothetical protein